MFEWRKRTGVLRASAVPALSAIQAPVPHVFKLQRPLLCRPMVITAIGKRPENGSGVHLSPMLAARRHAAGAHRVGKGATSGAMRFGAKHVIDDADLSALRVCRGSIGQPYWPTIAPVWCTTGRC